LLDNEGNVWCSHQRGLSSIQNPSFKIINYDKNDGIQDWDFNNRSFYKATDGTLFFGGVSGFNYFKPPLVSNTFYKPQVYIDEILINGKSYSDKVGHDFLKQIKLSFSENNISIKAIIKDLVNAKTKQLIYRIKENNLEWKYLPNNSQIIFNSMAPGSYTLQLGYYDKYTLETKFQKSLMITIGAPFYYKTWFIALVAMLLTLIIFGFYNQRKLRIQKAMFQQQMALERQRQKFIEDLHDDIGASLSSLQINSSVANRLIENDLGKAKIVLDKIEQQSKNLGERIGDFIWSLKPGFEEFIGISGRIKNFAYEILGNTNIDYDIDIDNNIDNLLKDFSSRKNILFITKEAINNAVKYSGAKKISISLQILSQSQGVLIINDDGKGFIVNAVNGNGLRNMQKRAQEIKADFRVNSIENRGTEISLRFKIVP
jgi:signal transduction histidine kinase